MTSRLPTPSDLPLKPTNPVRRALADIGVTQLAQLTTYTEAELLRLHGIGPKGIRMLRAALAERGLAFADEAAR